ncbi:MAG: ABC transporter ATP-binding protein [Propionibacteriaceae bacterium]|jgi:putative spermidine/putrescine transport system ATP-binding protein|nr:ABC transporter ATP-binding protein [Propionibacteriaceae bacterium]
MTQLSQSNSETFAAASLAAKSGTEVRLEGVTKDFGLAKPAVDDITLRIEPGEFMTLLGPSGSGKTTTLNLIAGFEVLTKGQVLLNGQDVGALPPHKRNLGMLFQNYALFPHMSVYDNVAYPLRERKTAKDEIQRRVGEVLELVQLVGRDKHLPKQLSGGQQQRVALARAIVFNPKVLLLDEPLGALDRNLRGALQLEIRRIHREVGSTFVFVTHDQDEAMNLSDRIALFNEGEIEQVGAPEELYARPETLFTAKFLGDSNVFHLGKVSPIDNAVAWEDERWAVDANTVSPKVASDRGSALVVRPEGVSVSKNRSEVPPDANAVKATILDIEYLGSYRTLVLALGDARLNGRARIDAQSSDFSLGEEVVAWWRPYRQRLVAE